ncbi:MAG: hypothetical protein SFU53_05425 [Terrimicrobiaceae bacterium]|nr:hypothetical protein [Terrimicrobiaceae bacterium]
MKVFIVLLVVIVSSAGSAPAQTVPAADSAFGNGEGVNGEVFAMAVQADGKIVIAGQFTAVNGVPRQNVARLNPDGSLDTSWSSQYAFGANGPVYAVAVDSQGGVVVGGSFQSAGDAPRSNLARLDGTSGQVDPAFGGPSENFGTNGTVRAIAVRPDGRLVIGGEFTSVHARARRNIALLQADGTLVEPAGAAESVNGTVRALGVLDDGRVVAAGAFSSPKQPAHGLMVLD